MMTVSDPSKRPTAPVTSGMPAARAESWAQGQLSELTNHPDAKVKAEVIQLPTRQRAIKVSVEGRRLFIPVVAFNIVYGWGERGRGQISASYLVGVEGKAPSEKMGAFRLDLGPRIYRTVGQRPHRLERRA